MFWESWCHFTSLVFLCYGIRMIAVITLILIILYPRQYLLMTTKWMYAALYSIITRVGIFIFLYFSVAFPGEGKSRSV